MINRSIIETLFQASSIERWNDHPRPFPFTEMDKQAHKFVIAYVAAKGEEDLENFSDWDGLIEAGFFEYLQRVIVTDIKPPVFHRIMADERRRKALNLWVLDNLKPLLSPLPGGLWERCGMYFLDMSYRSQIKKYLQGAHFLATKWEFDLIYPWSRPLYGIEKTKEEIYRQVRDSTGLQAFKAFFKDESLALGEGKGAFISMVGQLRFQKRWAQTPRVPQTSVLGHLAFVGLLAWLVLLEIGGSAKRRYNAFYGGLFHDLPEVLTRDIVSPVKRSVEGLEEIIKDIETDYITKEVLPMLPESWSREILSFVKDEFENRLSPACGKTKIIEGDFEKDQDLENPIDGRVIEACDKLAAFIEASQSIRIGIKSPELFEGKRNIYEKFKDKTLGGYPIGVLFDYFR